MAEAKDQFIENFLTPPIRLFLEACLVEKGITKSDPKIINDMVLDLAPRLYDWIWQAVFSNMPENLIEEWKQVQEQHPEETWSFLQNKIPNFDAVVEQAMQEFKNIYVNA